MGPKDCTDTDEAMAGMLQFLIPSSDRVSDVCHGGHAYSRIIEEPAPLIYGRSDADWVTSDVDERRTVIGYIVMLSGAAIL